MNAVMQARAHAPGRSDNRKVFLVLLAASLVSQAAIIPYAMATLPAAAQMTPTTWALQILSNLPIAGLMIALGLWLGENVGLGAPLLRAALAGDAAARRQLGRQLPFAAAIGVATGVVIWGLAAVFGPLLPGFGAAQHHAAAWQVALASLYGAIQEELLVRLCIMTLLAWVGSRLLRQAQPSRSVMWGALMLSAVVFGAGHLPKDFALYGATWLTVAVAMPLNMIGGLAFGWLYWRRGLVAAGAAHLVADLVLHGFGGVA